MVLDRESYVEHMHKKCCCLCIKQVNFVGGCHQKDIQVLPRAKLLYCTVCYVMYYSKYTVKNTFSGLIHVFLDDLQHALFKNTNKFFQITFLCI